MTCDCGLQVADSLVAANSLQYTLLVFKDIRKHLSSLVWIKYHAVLLEDDWVFE